MRIIWMKLMAVSLLGLFLFASCQDDDSSTREDLSNPVWSNCLVDEEIERDSTYFHCFFSIDPPSFCDTLNFMTPIQTPSEVKSWMPNYCAEVGDKIYFIDTRGSINNGTIISKNYRESRYSTIIQDRCSDPNANVLVCGVIEFISMEIYLEPLKRSFSLNIQGSRFIDEFGASVNPNLYIYSSTEGKSQGYCGILENGNFKEENRPSDKFHQSINLGGMDFEDVVEFRDYNNDPEKNSFFYSKHYGIVSFTDDDGEQWVYVI